MSRYGKDKAKSKHSKTIGMTCGKTRWSKVPSKWQGPLARLHCSPSLLGRYIFPKNKLHIISDQGIGFCHFTSSSSNNLCLRNGPVYIGSDLVHPMQIKAWVPAGIQRINLSTIH